MFAWKVADTMACECIDVQFCILLTSWLWLFRECLQVRGLSAFAVELDFLVEEYAASKGQFPPRQRRSRQSLYVATIEKANSLVNSLIEHGRIDSLGLVVVDEVRTLWRVSWVDYVGSDW